MPFSFSAQLSTIVGFMEEADPMSVLDIGVGMGQYGFLARMNLENVALFEVDGCRARLKEPSEWIRTIDGIEAFPTYLNPVHNYVYNEVKVGDARDILPTIKDATYDFVLAVDIVEHFEKSEAAVFLAEIKRVTRKHALVATPKQWIEQEVEANPFENHLSFWTESDLEAEGFVRILPNPLSWIAVWDWDNPVASTSKVVERI